jgi:uncharacterized protein DUF5916
VQRLAGLLAIVHLSAINAFGQTPEAPASTDVKPLAESQYETIRRTRILTAVRITESITLDGRPDEPAWKLATPATDFIQRIPQTGMPSKERTEIRILYDDDNLYVGVVCWDSQPSRMVIKELKKDFDINGTDLIQVIIDSLHDGRTGFALSINPAGARRDNQLSGNASNPDWDGVWDAKARRTEQGWSAEYVIPFKTLRFSNAESQEWGIQFARRIPRLNEESEWSPLPFRSAATRTNFAGTLRGLERVSQGRNFKVKPYVLGQQTQTVVNGQLVTTKSFGSWDDFGRGVDLKYGLTSSMTLDATYRTDFAQVEADQQQVNLTRFNLFFPEKREFFLENTGIFAFGPGGNLVPFFSRRIGLSATGTPIPVVGGGRVSGRVTNYDIGVLSMRTEALGATPANNYLVARIKRNVLRNSYIGALGTHRDSTRAGDYNRVFGADAHFQFYNDKLEFDSFLLGSETPDKEGANQARRLQGGWRSDELTANLEYNLVQPNFNPEVGFVRRGNISQYNGEFAWKPRVTHDTIQNLNFATSVDYYKTASTDRIETRVQDATVGLQYRNNGSTNFTVTRTFDRLTRPFEIHTGITIPVGDYEYQSYTGSFNMGNNRKVTGNASATWGEFWDGDNTSVGGAVGFRPDYHVNIDINFTRNHVVLPYGRFATNLLGTKFLYAFNPRAFFNAFIQYNTDTHQVSSNIRFNLTHHPLSDLYLVYNDTRDTSRGDVVGRSFAVKLTQLFNF